MEAPFDAIDGCARRRGPAAVAQRHSSRGCGFCVRPGGVWATDEAWRSVLATTSGYTGGSVQRPTYLQTCTGTTGHAEAVQVLYDTSKVTYEKLLDVYWCAP